MDRVDTLLSVSAVLPVEAQRAAPAPGSSGEAAPRPFAPDLSEGDRHVATADSREAGAGDDVPAYDITWGEFLDIINPLQHIPILSSLYRTVTGDSISGAARVMGSTLYGGPIGLIAGAANAIAAEVNGADLGDTLVAKLLGEDLPGEAVEGGTLLADAEPPNVTAPDLAPAADAAEAEEGAPPLASAFAPSFETPGQILTGDAALSALMGDLRGEDPRPRPDNGLTPAPLAAVTSEPLAPPVVEPGLIPAGAPGAVPVQAFAKQMMLGLDKYRAMALERGGAGRPDPEGLDRSL